MPTFDIEDNILKLRDSVSNVDRRAPYRRVLAVGGHALHGVAQLNRIGRRTSWSDVYTHGHFHLFDRRFFKLLAFLFACRGTTSHSDSLSLVISCILKLDAPLLYTPVPFSRNLSLLFYRLEFVTFTVCPLLLHVDTLAGPPFLFLLQVRQYRNTVFYSTD